MGRDTARRKGGSETAIVKSKVSTAGMVNFLNDVISMVLYLVGEVPDVL